MVELGQAHGADRWERIETGFDLQAVHRLPQGTSDYEALRAARRIVRRHEGRELSDDVAEAYRVAHDIMDRWRSNVRVGAMRFSPTYILAQLVERDIDTIAFRQYRTIYPERMDRTPKL